ncbi:MAG: hypothetical protein Q4B22_08690 [Eubacteriales bacterium]|nr:hypothetical protein [Eubacteriales bacterium]
MMSGISSNKFLKMEMRQSRWLPALIMAAGIFLYPIPYLMQLTQSSEQYRSGRLSAAAEYVRIKTTTTYAVLGAGNFIALAAVAAAAVLAAAVGFSYLTSRERTDFYHSLAIGRRRLFRLAYAHGWLSAVVPYLCCMLLAYPLIGGLLGTVTWENTGVVLTGIGSSLLAFTAVYSVCVLAFCLCGRILTGILLSGMLLGYGPICYYLIYVLAQQSFQTYFYRPGVWGRLGLYLSPVTAEYFFINGLRPGSIRSGIADTVFESPLAAAVLLLLYAAAAGLLAGRLFVQRKSETAGEALISRRAETWIKVLVAIPGGAFWGLFLGEIFNVNWSGHLSGKLFCIGFAVLGAFLVGGIIEFIFTADLKNIFRHWRSAGIGIAGAAVILSFFAFDWIGYDRYFPKQNELQGMAVAAADSTTAAGYFYIYDTNAVVEVLRSDCDENFARSYAMLEQYREGRTDEQKGITVHVLYRLRSGKEKYRSYSIPADAWHAYLLKQTENPAEREKVYKCSRIRSEELEEVSVSGWELLSTGNDTLSLSGKDAEELVRVLNKDVQRYSLAELQDMKPVGTLRFSLRNEEYAARRDGAFYEVGTIYVYPGYTETIRWFTGKGIDVIVLDEAVETLPIKEWNKDMLVSMGVESLEMYSGTANGVFSFSTSGKDEILQVLQNVEQVQEGVYSDEETYYLYLNYGMNTKSAMVRVLDAEVLKMINEKYNGASATGE